MKAVLVLLSALAVAAAQGVTQQIAPKNSYPAACVKQVDGPMWLTVKDVTAAKRDLDKRDSPCTEGHLVVKLSDGVLTDSKGRTGYIASNYQFQFDAPAQAGALYTAGFSQCGNGSLALGPTTTFYKCRSGDFWNLYDRTWAQQCEPVELVMYACSASPAADIAGPAGQIADGQVVATQFVTTTLIKPIADGQPQVITTSVPVPICQIDDGQVQGHTTPCAKITYPPKIAGPPPSAVPISQYSDGQIQVTPPAGGAPPPAHTAPAPGGGGGGGGGGAPPAGSPPAGSPPPAKGTNGPPAPTTPPKPSGSGPAPSPSPSTPAQNAGGRIQMASVAALVVGVVGAVVFL